MSTVGGRSRDKLHVMSCYAPTRAASRQEKDTFFDELDSILSLVPAGEKYIVLGDFNARVGSRQVVGDQWSKVRSLYGCGVINDAGKERLGFLSTQQTTVCNTWLQKKEEVVCVCVDSEWTEVGSSGATKYEWGQAK